MPHRLEYHVTKGEIDCRTRGKVTGSLTMHGRAKPMVLDLTGNACPDMAGCLLTFVNKGSTFAMPRDKAVALLQKGAAGDMTASRKVRVSDPPSGGKPAGRKRGKAPTERMANALHLEWFSEDGRVVFESAECKLTLSAPEWTMTPAENEQRASDAAAALSAFLDRLDRQIDRADSQVPWGKEKWDEFDHEKLLRESDARTDKYGELLEKYMDHPDSERIIAREMGWDHIIEMLDAKEAMKKEGSREEETEDELTAGGEAGEDSADDGGKGWDVPDNLDDYEEPEPDPATEGKEWIRTEDGDIRHPLQHRAFESAMVLWHRVEELGLKDSEDEDLWAMVQEFQILSAKLAGALNGIAQDRPYVDYAHNIARMKRGLTHLHASQAALVKVEEKRLLPEQDLGNTRTELFEIREEMLRLMEDFRQRPES